MKYKKKILIIGNTSVIAKYIQKYLAKYYEIKFAGRKNADYLLDLNDPNLKKIIFFKKTRFDIVVHFAADFGGNNFTKIFQGAFVNSLGTLKVCDIAKQVKAKHLIIISSIFAKLKPFHDYYNIYSISKKHGDELAQFYCHKFNLPLTILRPTAIYDAYSKCKLHQKLLYSIIDKAQKGKNIYFYGKNNALRNYLFVDDFSEIIFRIIKKKITGLYDCVHPKNLTISKIARIAYGVFNNRGKIFFSKNERNISSFPYNLSNKLYDKIKYRPKFSMIDGIKNIIKIRESM